MPYLQSSSDSKIAREAERRPFISVGVPTFRRPEKLRRAIDSVQRQTYADWELVVSDDEESSGEAWSIITEHARRDSRIRMIKNSRGRGQIGNTNNVLLACAGQWIKLLHDDDWLSPNSLETFADVARRHPSAAFLTCCINVMFDDRLKLYVRSGKRPDVSVYTTDECLTDLYLARTTRAIGIVPSTLLIRRDIIEAGCLMRTYQSVVSGVDQLFLLDLAVCGELVVVRDGLVFYDLTSHESVSSPNSFEQIAQQNTDPKNSTSSIINNRQKLFEQIDQETVDLKNLNWRLIKDRRRLPVPDVVVRALRIARLRNRYRWQPWMVTAHDAFCLLQPSVLRLVIETALVLARSEYRDFRFSKMALGASTNGASRPGDKGRSGDAPPMA